MTTYEIKNVFLEICDNSCLCIEVDQKTKDFICNRLNIEEGMRGEGTEGFINIQYPVGVDSQTYIAGGHFEDDIEGYHDDDEITDLVDSIICDAKQQVSRRDFELAKMFGTSDITSHDSLVRHGYYKGLNLCLLENNETSEAYVLFEDCLDGSFTEEFRTFDNVDSAKKYIKSHINNHQSLRDFGISHDIYNEICGSNY